METMTTPKTAVLNGLLETGLFKGLDQITNADLEARRAKMIEGRGSDYKEKGRIVGRLSDIEKMLLGLLHNLTEEGVRIAEEGLADKGEGVDKRQDRRFQTLERLKERAALIEKIFWYLLNDRFSEEVLKKDTCKMRYDAEFNVRVSTHEEEHGGFPDEIHVMVLGGRRGDPLDGLAELLAGLHGMRG